MLPGDIQMAEELQSLLDRIYADGVQKADAESDRIIAGARASADEIISEAKKNAQNIVSAAEKDAESLKLRAEAAVKQAARDIILELKSELEKRLDMVISENVAGAMTPQVMTDLIKNMAEKFASDPDADISVLCALKDEKELAGLLSGALRSSFAKDPKVFADSGINGGMEVSFRDGGVYYDFTIPALTELVGKFATERIAELLKD